MSANYRLRSEAFACLGDPRCLIEIDGERLLIAGRNNVQLFKRPTAAEPLEPLAEFKQENLSFTAALQVDAKDGRVRVWLGAHDSSLHLLTLFEHGKVTMEFEKLDSSAGASRGPSNNPVTLLARLDERHILISTRRSPCRVRDSETGRELRDSKYQRLCEEAGLQALRCAFTRPASGGQKGLSILVRESGRMWTVSDDGPIESSKRIWDARWPRPAFIADYALVPPRSDVGLVDKPVPIAYLVADTGIWQLELRAKADASERAHVRPVYLGGVIEPFVALSLDCDSEGRPRLLIACDVSGRRHLFVPGSEEIGHAVVWRRHVTEAGAEQPVRGMALSARSDTEDAVAVFTCRRDVLLKTAITKRDTVLGPETMCWGQLLGEEDLPHPSELDLNQGEPSHAADHIASQTAAFLEHVGLRFPALMRTFLESPSPELALRQLHAVLFASTPADLELRPRLRRSIGSWVFVLLGFLHRSEKRAHHGIYLGIVRWLRMLSQGWKTADGDQGPGSSDQEALEVVVDDALREVQKWGWFAESYLRDKATHRLLSRLTSGVGSSGRTWEQFALRARLLSSRAVEDTASDLHANADASEPGEFPAGRAWDMVVLSTGESAQVVVSWTSGHLDFTDVTERQARKVHHAPYLDSKQRPMIRCRAMSRVSSRDDVTYIAARTGRLATNRTEELHDLFRIWQPFSGKVEPVHVQVDALESDVGRRLADQRPYALLEVVPGRFVAGLSGAEGAGYLLYFDLEFSGGLWKAQATALIGLERGEPTRQHLVGNRVLSLALIEGVSVDDQHIAHQDLGFVAGCEDGSIYRLTLPWAESRFQVEVGRIRSGVRALAATYDEDTDTLRVIAGGADGALVCWQAKEPRKPDGLAYSMLWATRENGPASRIHVVSVPCEISEARRELPALACTFQHGGCVIINNASPPQESPDERLEPMRLPGSRIDRVDLQGPCFSSAVLPLDRTADGESSYLKLAIAGTDGHVRLLSLHYPKAMCYAVREREKLGEEVIRECLTSSTPSAFRHVEAAWRPAPLLARVLTRQILNPTLNVGDVTRLYAHRDWLPFYARPLVDVAKAWQEGDLTGQLDRALTLARRIGEPDLFKYIIRQVLDRANQELRQLDGVAPPLLARRGGSIRYEELVITILKNAREWPTTHGADIGVLSVLAKCLVDGRTFHALALHARTAGDSVTRAAASEAIRCRTSAVRTLLALGHNIISLECLRAVNLSFQRAILQGGAEVSTVEWGDVSGYVQTLADFGGRSGRYSGGGDQVIEHEIARGFALACAACPDATAQIALSACKTGMPRAIVEQVPRQMQLLQSVGILRSPNEAKLRRFAVVAQVDVDAGDLTKCFSPSNPLVKDLFEQPSTGDPTPDHKLASSWKPLFRILECLHLLAATLRRRAASVRPHDLLGAWDELPIPEDLEPFGDSTRFWQEQKKEFEQLKLFAGVVAPRERGVGSDPAETHVRPDVVLYSSELGEMCKKAIERLKGEYRRHEAISEPWGKMHEAALRAVADSARDFHVGTALQRDLVQVVLSHNLIEQVEEHSLSLWEIAQVLDPINAWTRRTSSDRRPTSAAERFSSYVLTLAQNSRSTPKSLRTLQAMISNLEDLPKMGGSLHTAYSAVCDRAWLWNDDNAPELWKGGTLDQLAQGMLSLTFHELIQNNVIHSGLSSGTEFSPIVGPGMPAEGEVITITFRFANEVDFDRLKAAERDGIQSPYSPREDRSVPSSGTGLYLANLAAAIAGWKLQIRKISYRQAPTARQPRGTVVFELSHDVKRVEAGQDSESGRA